MAGCDLLEGVLTLAVASILGHQLKSQCVLSWHFHTSTIGIVLSTRASGPCLSSPDRMPSECMYVSSCVVSLCKHQRPCLNLQRSFETVGKVITTAHNKKTGLLVELLTISNEERVDAVPVPLP